MPQTSGLVLGVVMGSLLLLAQPLGCGLDGFDDVRIARAAAEVAADCLSDVRLAGLLVARQQRAAGHHHPRRAVPALQPVLVPERFLDGVELAVLLQALHGADLRAVRLDREHRARLHRLAVEQHGAGAAVRGVAADVRPGQAQVLAQEVDEQQPGLDPELVRGAVHRHPDLVCGHGHRPPARSTAFFSARAASTRPISRLYSTEPRRSALGDATASARSASMVAGWSLAGSPCARFPPTVARLRTSGSAITRAVSRRMGYRSWIRSDRSSTASRVRPPMRRKPPSSRTYSSPGMRPMSTR